jgi:hypothetical protein
MITGRRAKLDRYVSLGRYGKDSCLNVHSSPSNPSPRRRAGLTIRYSGTNVKNDLSVNPNFKAYLCRGVDEYHRNPVGVPPTQRFARAAFKAVSIEEASVDRM